MFTEKKGLEFFLNVSRVAARLMSVGRVFHRRGAAASRIATRHIALLFTVMTMLGLMVLAPVNDCV